MLKKIIVGVVILIVLLAGAADYLWFNLDSIVKSAIEKYGTEATGTDVRLSSVKISISSGEGALAGLSVANPKGFSSAKAFVMGAVSVSIDTSSIAGGKPIVIREVNIEKPQVTYEVTANGSSNLQAIEHNTMKYADASSGNSNGGNTNSTDSKNGKTSKEERKIIINDLYIRSGEIQITSNLLQGKTLTAPLPVIHLTNIGKNTGGATPAQVAEQVINSIATSTANVATSELAKQIPALKNVPASGTIGNTLKGLLGK